MKFLLLYLLSFPFLRRSAVNTEAYLRAREYMSSKKYEQAGTIADSLIKEGYRDKEVLKLLVYSLYQRGMWDSIVNLSENFKKFRLPRKSQEYSDIMFMTAVAYYKKSNVSFAVYYAGLSATGEENKKRAVSFVKNYLGMAVLPENLSIEYLIKPLAPGILMLPNEPEAVKTNFVNGFALGLNGSIPYVEIKGVKDVRKVSLIVGPLLSSNVNSAYGMLSIMGEPSIFPLSEDIRIGISQPLYPLNRRYAIELEKGIELFADKLGYLNYAIYYEGDDPVALSGRLFLEKRLKDRGLYIVEERYFTKDSINILTEIDSTTGENWDLVFVLGRSDFALTLATTFRREVEDLPVFVFSDFEWKVVQGGYVGLNGIIFAGVYSGIRKMLDIASLKERFEDKYNAQFGSYPSLYAARGYDVGMLLQDIVTHVDTFNRKNVWNYLYNLGVYEGISGYYLFRDDPSLIKVYTFKNGRVVEYKEE